MWYTPSCSLTVWLPLIGRSRKGCSYKTCTVSFLKKQILPFKWITLSNLWICYKTEKLGIFCCQVLSAREDSVSLSHPNYFLIPCAGLFSFAKSAANSCSSFPPHAPALPCFLALGGSEQFSHSSERNPHAFISFRCFFFPRLNQPGGGGA